MYLALLTPGWLPALTIGFVLVVAVTFLWLGRTTTKYPAKQSRLETAQPHGKPYRRADLYQGLLDDPDW